MYVAQRYAKLVSSWRANGLSFSSGRSNSVKASLHGEVAFENRVRRLDRAGEQHVREARSCRCIPAARCPHARRACRSAGFRNEAAEARVHAVDVHELVVQVRLPLPQVVAAIGRAHRHQEIPRADAAEDRPVEHQLGEALVIVGLHMRVRIQQVILRLRRHAVHATEEIDGHAVAERLRLTSAARHAGLPVAGSVTASSARNRLLVIRPFWKSMS